MPAHAVPIDVKEKGVMWLLPPYSWSVRHIAQKLALSSSVVAKWRLAARKIGYPEINYRKQKDSRFWKYAIPLSLHLCRQM
ncbi:hypothetical protein WKV47_21945 [Salmonella enterica]